MTRQELDSQLSPIAAQQTQILRTITIALLMGVVMFAGVCVFLSKQPHPASSGDASVGELLTLVELVFACAAWAASFIIPGFIRKARLRDALEQSALAAIEVDRSARILGLALREGAALFGLVVVVNAIVTGNLDEAPWLWVNALPGAAFILHTLATFPSADAIRNELLTTLVLD